MPSKQAMEAAEKIDKMVAGMILASMTGGPVSGSSREKIAAIIDAAFAPVVAELQERTASRVPCVVVTRQESCRQEHCGRN